MTIRVEEKSLQLALVKAAGQLGVTQTDLDHKVITESAGFLGIFGKKIAIEAWVKTNSSKTRQGGRSASNRRSNSGANRNTNRRQDPPPSKVSSRRRASERNDQPFEEKIPLTEAEISALKQEIANFCQGICSRIVHEEVTVKHSSEDGRLVLNIENDALATQITKNTKLAEALEHILRKKPRHLRRELPFRIFVDCNNVRKNREAELVEMANDLSFKVSENKRPVILNYRSSYDRKIIHMALDKDKRVYTKSIGSGPNRKLMILPTGGQVEDAHEIDVN